MIDQDFDDFDPRLHQWVVFHFGWHSEEQAGKLRALLQKIVEAVADDAKNPFEVVERAIRNGVLQDAYDSIDLKPGFRGVSIDLKRSYKALKTHLRDRKSHGPHA